MRFLIYTDIEGVTGVTTYSQAESGEFGRQMLMNDLKSVIDGIQAAGEHEIVVYDMHTDGRNINLSELEPDIPVVMGKPICGERLKGLKGQFDGLFMIGLHAMSGTPDALLAHTYLKEYAKLFINGELVGEIGMEAALAGENSIPLLFVSGDDCGCREAEAQFPSIQAAVVKESLGDAQALCYPPARTRKILFEKAKKAASTEKRPEIIRYKPPFTITVEFSDCAYLQTLKRSHPEIFTSSNSVSLTGDNLLKCWAEYLEIEKEMVRQ